MQNLDLKGQVALITGAASGIGAACVTRLAGLGATLVGVDVDDGAGEQLFAGLGGQHRYRHLDVADLDGWKQLLSGIAEDFGRLDILHLNAGVMSRPKGAPLLDDPLEWFTASAYRKVRSVNMDGVVYGLIAAIAQGGISRIVITASGAAISPLPMDPFYAATKFAELGLGLSLVPSLAERDTRIDVICPGAIDTAITAPDIRASFRQESPSFIADALVTVLASPDAPNHAWLAYTEAEGVQPYLPGGSESALDELEDSDR